MHRTKVKVVEDALDANSTIAAANRADFDRADVRVVNLMSAPGAGKTTLLERALGELDGLRAGVLEGDVQGSMDADRLAALHIPVTQLNTDSGFGGECHLDANMVRSALGELPLADLDLLVIENVGNLVCPAEFRVGEDVRMMVSSVTEGEDKPLKYPLMFRACELVVVNKIDLLPHLDFDLDRFLYNLDAVNPGRGAHAGQRSDGRRSRRVPRLAGRRHAAAPAGGGGRVNAPTHAVAAGSYEAALAARTAANAEWFPAEAERLARLCHRMAERFARGGRLIALGSSPAARSDVRHIAVEFVHPVIVGKARAPGDRAGLGGRRPPPPGRARRPSRATSPSPSAPVPRTPWRWPANGDASRWPSRPRAPSGSSTRRARTRSCVRSSPRRPTTCCGSSCTCSSTTGACSRAATRGPFTTPARRASSIRSWPSARPTSTPCSTTSAARCS